MFKYYYVIGNGGFS